MGCYTKEQFFAVHSIIYRFCLALNCFTTFFTRSMKESKSGLSSGNLESCLAVLEQYVCTQSFRGFDVVRSEQPLDGVLCLLGTLEAWTTNVMQNIIIEEISSGSRPRQCADYIFQMPQVRTSPMTGTVYCSVEYWGRQELCIPPCSGALENSKTNKLKLEKAATIHF